MKWESKGAPPNATPSKKQPALLRGYEQPYFLEETWHWGGYSIHNSWGRCSELPCSEKNLEDPKFPNLHCTVISFWRILTVNKRRGSKLQTWNT